jgi:hypothetical protein
MQISVKSNISAFAKAMDAFGKNQIPFATHRAINKTAFDVRDEIVKETFPKSFTVRNKRFASQMFRVDKATKRNLTARVYDRLGRDYMTNQAEGGIKRPRGNNIAIPSRQLKRTASGKVPKAKQPRNVLGGRGYRTTLDSGQPIIAEQTGRGAARKQRVLYILENIARIPKRFPFYEDANKTAGRMFDRNFKKSFAFAKQTARRQTKGTSSK